MSAAPRSFALASLMLALVAGASEARAQRGPGVTVESAKSAKISAAPGAVITTAFTVKNATRDSVVVEPILSLPKGWHTVMTAAPSLIGPGRSDLWLISVTTPVSAPTGRYVIRLRLGVGVPHVARGDVWGVGTARDSVVVSIGERREIALRAGAAPTFAMGGDTYTAQFLVRHPRIVEPGRRAQAERHAIGPLPRTDRHHHGVGLSGEEVQLRGAQLGRGALVRRCADVER